MIPICLLKQRLTERSQGPGSSWTASLLWLSQLHGSRNDRARERQKREAECYDSVLKLPLL